MRLSRCNDAVGVRSGKRLYPWTIPCPAGTTGNAVGLVFATAQTGLGKKGDKHQLPWNRRGPFAEIDDA